MTYCKVLTHRLNVPFRVCLSLLLALGTVCPSASAARAQRVGEKTALAGQQFFCVLGYDRQQCSLHIAKLKSVLVQFPVDAPQPWNWVIVRSEDWQSLTAKLHLDRRSPAFTAIDDRDTFLEEALFSPGSKRTNELLRDYQIPYDSLLSFAVSHELGHALCGGGSEASANQISEQLRRGQQAECRDAMGSLTRIDELYLQRRASGLRPRR
jgi:hypothetical protein